LVGYIPHMDSVKRFTAECIDKATGRTHMLRLSGSDESAARSLAADWGFVTGRLSSAKPKPFAATSLRTQRHGVSIDPGPVHLASSSENLIQMLNVMDTDCHPVDRHFLLQNTAEAAYKLRATQPAALHICETACWQWLLEAGSLVPALRIEFKSRDAEELLVVSVLAPRRLVILLEKLNETGRALDVCLKAASLGLRADDAAYLTDKASKLGRRARAAGDSGR